MPWYSWAAMIYLFGFILTLIYQSQKPTAARPTRAFLSAFFWPLYWILGPPGH